MTHPADSIVFDMLTWCNIIIVKYVFQWEVFHKMHHLQRLITHLLKCYQLVVCTTGLIESPLFQSSSEIYVKKHKANYSWNASRKTAIHLAHTECLNWILDWICSTLKATNPWLRNATIPLARLHGFSQWCHGSIHVLRVKGHACLHHQNAAVAHCMIHAVILAKGCAIQEMGIKILRTSKVTQVWGWMTICLLLTYHGFRRARASANLLFRKSSRAAVQSFRALSKSICGDLHERYTSYILQYSQHDRG